MRIGAVGRGAIGLVGVLTVVLSGCSSHQASVSASTSTTRAASRSTTVVPAGAAALVGTWTNPHTVVPVACPISGEASTATASACPAPLADWDQVGVVSVARDGTVRLTFPALGEGPSTTCVGHLQATGAGVGVTQLTCSGAAAVTTASFASPVAPTLSGGCLTFPPDAHFEGHPGACSTTTSEPTITFGPVTSSN